MDSCDVLIVGGGPAGSSCAWKLRQSGLDVVVLDRARFPRDKTCGGWITPRVLAQLQLDASEYSRARVLQPVTGFRTSIMGRREVETLYDAPVSYGIRRCEFDDYLLKRSQARIRQGSAAGTLTRVARRWVVNGEFKARLLVGAGGHFCPVARLLGAKVVSEAPVVGEEIELELDPAKTKNCSICGEIPEISFCSDLKGYGWCFRKGSFLNIGLGRLDPHHLGEHVRGFLRFLRTAGKISFELPHTLPGHAYLLARTSTRKVIDDDVLLVGDAAGLAYAQSGEGILPAIESGLLAAETILAARGDYRRAQLKGYAAHLAQRFGHARDDWATRIGLRLPAWLVEPLMRQLMSRPWFARALVIDRWFLRAGTHHAGTGTP